MFNESNLSKAMGRYKNPNLVTMVNPDLLDSFTNNERNSNLITLSNVNDYIAHKQDKVKYITVRAFLNEHWNDGFLTEQNASFESKTEIEPTSNEDDKIDLHISECALNMKERCLCFLDHKIPFGYDRTGHIVFRGLNLARALGYTRPDNALLEHTKPNMHVTTVYNIPTPTPSTQVGVYTKYTPSDNADAEEHELVERCVLHGTGFDGIWILEPGLYALIFASRLPMAEQFREWVYWTVLPSLRSAGLLPYPIHSENMSQYLLNDKSAKRSDGIDIVSFPSIALNAFDGKKVVYLFYLKHYNALKFGRSEDLRERAQDHYNSYSKHPGDVIAVHVIITEYPCKIEQEIKDQCKARGWRLNDLYVNGRLQTEIIDLTKTTIDNVVKLMNEVSQQYTESIKKRKADIVEQSIEHQKEITRQLEARARIAKVEAEAEAAMAQIAEAEARKEEILLKKYTLKINRIQVTNNTKIFQRALELI